VVEKRIVIKETSGLWRIVGCEDTAHKRPTFVSFPDGSPSISLIRVKPRYVLYQELRLLSTGVLNEFHPEQT
jgi:hypothetical protein